MRQENQTDDEVNAVDRKAEGIRELLRARGHERKRNIPEDDSHTPDDKVGDPD